LEYLLEMMISCKVAAVTAVTGFTIGTVAPTCLLGSQHKRTCALH
jgi:hypothetical protein